MLAIYYYDMDEFTRCFSLSLISMPLPVLCMCSGSGYCLNLISSFFCFGSLSIFTCAISCLMFTESRRDQEEGGELDSHEEVRHFCGSR